MVEIFVGKKLADEIKNELKNTLADFEIKPKLAIVSIGANSVTEKYLKIKKEFADEIDLEVELIKLSSEIKQTEAENEIKNIDADGVIIQIPIPKHLDRKRLIEQIPAEKDVDGLRFCADFSSVFTPPVVLAIDLALKKAGVNFKNSNILIVGKGFLVGHPLVKYLTKIGAKNIKSIDIDDKISMKKYDVIISAVGKADLISAEQISENSVLIDAGTSEKMGKIVGDFAPDCYKKSRFYTPVPGGIGPLTVAMIYKNLIQKSKAKSQN